MTPKPLNPGDLIAVAAPAGPFDRRRFLRGVRQLKASGFRIAYQKNIFSRRGYLAGDDSRRAHELKHWFEDSKSKALLFARGGYGCQRLLPLLHHHDRPKVVPKGVVGSSDLTVILNYLWKYFRLPSFYGPMVAPHLGLLKNALRLRRALTDPHYFQKHKIGAKEILKPGRAEGRLIGGCLSLIVSTLGTPFEVETKGSILFLEDTNEEPYEVDRMLTQLEQAGKLKGVRGILLGTFKQKNVLFPKKIRDVFIEKLKSFRGPVLWGVRFGHCRDPLLIPLGGRARMEGRDLIITKNIFT